jgi:hypothetical protein
MCLGGLEFALRWTNLKYFSYHVSRALYAEGTPRPPCMLYPDTVFRDGIYQSFTVNPSNGNLLMARENATDGFCYGPTGQCYGVVAADTNILLYESTDGGLSWNQPLIVNDNSNEPTNQFQPSSSV